MYTIGDTAWEYLPLLNTCIQILLTVLAGALFGRFGGFDQKTFVPPAVKFVFGVALPVMIVGGIGIGIDFYDDSNNWTYIAAFLVLRLIYLIVSFLCVIATGWREDGIGMVTVYWLNFTWISTVILGIPISEAVFGSKQQGQKFGLLAGVSSFIFQLPLQLLFLECHALEKELCNTNRAQTEHHRSADSIEIVHQDQQREKQEDELMIRDQNNGGAQDASAEQQREKGIETEDQHHIEDKHLTRTSAKKPPLLLWLQFARRGDVWRCVLCKVLCNPVFLGILGGFFLSLTTVGPRFLNPTSSENVPGLNWFFMTTSWFGATVNPVSLFTMGIWMQDQGKNLFKAPLYQGVLSMLSKLILCPLLMVGLAKGFGLDDEAGRAAVLISALPISMASFSLASHYNLGQNLLSSNVALGTLFMLPTVLAWNLGMDKFGLFPIQSSSS